MKRIFILTFTSFLLNGCGLFLTEPYPVWTVSVITQNDIPQRVTKSFRNKYPGVTIVKVERSVFESRLTGRPKLYRFTFESEKEKEKMVILDEKGEPSNLDLWFDTNHKPMK